MIFPKFNQSMNFANKKLGDFVKRQSHLDQLNKIEKMLHEYSPLSCSYDVSRMQPPFFNEFTYTELLGGLVVSPQSSHAQAQMIEVAYYENHNYDILKFIKFIDKYKLESIKSDYPSRIVFIPGTNLFFDNVSKENLSRLMFENDDIFIKPHPLTDDGLLRLLGREFGYHRILKPEDSGMNYLINAKEIWVTTSTELGLYGMLLEKTIHNISNFFEEKRGSFNAFYRMLWKHSIPERKKILNHMLASPLSGWLHPEDDKLKERLEIYFTEAMKIRHSNKPLIYEYSSTYYQEIFAKYKTNKQEPLPQHENKKELNEIEK